VIYHVQFHYLAHRELSNARQWYRRQSEDSEDRFRKAVDVAVRRVEKSFDSLPAIERNYRFLKVGRYPYILICKLRNEATVGIVAVQHTSRRPGYWRRRK
jgi:hypothetical protein